MRQPAVLFSFFQVSVDSKRYDTGRPVVKCLILFSLLTNRKNSEMFKRKPVLLLDIHSLAFSR
jgi:hypothetical protein